MLTQSLLPLAYAAKLNCKGEARNARTVMRFRFRSLEYMIMLQRFYIYGRYNTENVSAL